MKNTIKIVFFCLFTVFLLHEISSESVGRNSKNLCRQALASFGRGERETSLKYLKEALKQDPGCYYAYSIMGDIYYSMGKLEESKSSYKKALKLNCEYLPALKGLSIIFSKQKDCNAAIKQCESILKLQPDHSGTYIILGDCYLRMDMYDKAAATYQKGIRYNSKNPKFFYNFALACFRLKNFESAFIYAHKAISLKPDYPQAYYLAGSVKFEERDYSCAQKYLALAIKHKPDYADAYLVLGRIHIEMNEPDKGLLLFAKASQIDPSNPIIYYEQGVIHYKNKNYASAREYFEKSLKFNGEFAPAHWKLAKTYIALGENEKAQNEYDILKKMNNVFADDLES